MHGDNTTYCFADSGHAIPRSYGCTISMMNGAVTSLSAKKHTLTATSTCHDELIEFSIAVNRMVGFRNIMCEMGLEQEQATTIYQDNEAAVSIAMNRGSLSKQSRHMERQRRYLIPNSPTSEMKSMVMHWCSSIIRRT